MTQTNPFAITCLDSVLISRRNLKTALNEIDSGRIKLPPSAAAASLSRADEKTKTNTESTTSYIQYIYIFFP